MKQIKILIPVYNDWQSVFELLKNINWIKAHAEKLPINNKCM